MKKALAVMLSLLIACTVFACFVHAAGDAAQTETTKDRFNGAITKVVTDVFGRFSADYSRQINAALAWMRDTSKAAADYFSRLSDQFDRVVEWFQNIRISNPF